MRGTDSTAGGSRADGGSDGRDGSRAGSDAPERIMRATYRALCKRGYASLTMRDIADESELSKAALHYHFDSKADLLRTFLEHLLDSFRERATAETDGEDPFERVRTLVGLLFEPPGGDADAEFRTALLELKAQAPYEPPVRDRLLAFDEFLRAEIAAGVRETRERGGLRADVDPEAVAEFVVTVANGAHTRRVALGRSTDSTEAHLMDYLDGLYGPDEVAGRDVTDARRGEDGR